MDRDRIAEMFDAFGPVDVRRLFGGYGVFADGIMFALAHGGALFLKADEESRRAFESEGQGPFTYQRKNGQRTALSYWRVPERLYDEPDELAAWATTALAVARRADVKTPRKRGGMQASAVRARKPKPPGSASARRLPDRSRR